MTGGKALLLLAVPLLLLCAASASASASASVSGRKSSIGGAEDDLPAYCGRAPGVRPAIPPLSARDLPPSGKLSLKAVAVVIRHGDRTSSGWNLLPNSFSRGNCFPGDSAVWKCDLVHDSAPGISSESQQQPFPVRLYRKRWDFGVEEQVGDCAMGQLTMRGFEQQLANGAGLREAYLGAGAKVGTLAGMPDVLDTAGSNGRDFDQKWLHLRADDSPRTLMSAQALMLGLYDPSKGQQVPPGSGARLEIHSRDVPESEMYPNPAVCPRVKSYQDEAKKSPAYVKYMRENVDPLLVKLSQAIGVTNLTFGQACALFDCSLAHVCHSFDIPSELRALLPKLVEVRTWTTNYNYLYPSRDAFSKVGMGFLLRDIVDHIDDVLKTGQAPFALWSGHDSTLMPLMMALNGSNVNTVWCPYAGLGSFEIWQSGNETYIRVVDFEERPITTLPGCAPGRALCLYSDFRSAVLDKLVVKNAYDDCKPTGGSYVRTLDLSPQARHLARITEELKL